MFQQAAAGIENGGSSTHTRAEFSEALERLMQLYNAWGKPDQATRWRRDLESEKADAKPPDQ
jgi:hypothetical protein